MGKYSCTQYWLRVEDCDGTFTTFQQNSKYINCFCYWYLSISKFSNGKFLLDDNVLAEAKKRYDAVVTNGGERLISGSDDFTLFLWTPENSKNSVGNWPSDVHLKLFVYIIINKCIIIEY